MRLGSLFVAMLASLPTAARAATPPCPSKDELLDRAGRYVAGIEQELAVLVGDEAYSQYSYWGASAMHRAKRVLASDVAWVPTGDAMVWAFYRDVRSVDGLAVRDRSARLEALFPEGQTPAANARALRILDESSRYNLGQRRTVNSPTLALTLLHPRNRKRSSFETSGGGRKEGVPACKLLYEERKRPTLISNPDGEDVPARGAFWIEPGSGAVVASSLELKTPGHDPVLIETSFRHEAALACWLPAEMKETYGGRAPRPGSERLEAVARYSAWRRAHVEVEVIIPK
ncbi:MAG TPA: hypothetical protein VIJ10_16585 [Vicinamibacteria bacterium]